MKLFSIQKPEFDGGMFRLLPSGFSLVYSVSFFPPKSIDRIVITVANQVITQSQIDDEIRVTAFLNREKVDLSADARKQAAAD